MKDTYEFEPHSPRSHKYIGKSVCSKCGLIYLNNPFTTWAIKYGCNSEDHPNFEKERAKTGFNYIRSTK